MQEKTRAHRDVIFHGSGTVSFETMGQCANNGSNGAEHVAGSSATHFIGHRVKTNFCVTL